MIDRFKFRVWDKQDECYAYSNNSDVNLLYIETDGHLTYGVYSNDYEDMNYIPESEVIIEQCTGLKDANGKLIYEGDIVKIIDKSSRKEPFIGVVEYTNTASFEANCNGFYMHLHNPKTPENVSMIEKMFCSSLREIEIIGNIHENTDLLEEKNNVIFRRTSARVQKRG